MRLSHLLISIGLLTNALSAIANGNGKPVPSKSDKVIDLKSDISLTEFENITINARDTITPGVTKKSPTANRQHTQNVNEQLRDIEKRINSDVDADGFSIAEGDCDDNDPSTYPNAVDTADGIDNDCDGLIDNSMVQK